MTRAGHAADQATRRIALVALLVLTAFVKPVVAEDWPNFRGPRHDGISSATGLKTTWTEPMRLVWQREVGSGFSGISILGDRAYTCGTRDGSQVAFCLNADTGEPLWRTVIEKAYFEGQGGSGPRATPTVSGGRVYVLGALGRFVCLDAADGRVLWSKEFGGKPTWGFSGSALVEGDQVIVSAGGRHGALVSFDPASGAERWKCGNDPVGYSTPYPFTFEGQRYICVFTAKSALVARAGDGREVLRIPWDTSYDVNAAAPIVHEGHLFLSSGYDTGSALFRLRRNGDRLSAEKVWGINKVLLAKFQSPVLYDGHLYCSDQRKLACVEFLTGAEKWSDRSIRDSTIVLAQGNLFIQKEDGALIIAPARPAAFQPTTRAELLTGRCWTVPTIHNGRLYVRNLDTVKCFSLSD